MGSDLGDAGMRKVLLQPWNLEALLLGWDYGDESLCWTLYRWDVACTEPLCLQPGAALRRDSAFQSFVPGVGLSAASFAGAEVVASLDISPYAAAHLRGNSHGVVFEAGLEELQPIFEMHIHLGSRSATAFLGLPCQPFSAQGRQLAERDHRFGTLLYSLRVAWFLPVQALIAECVPAAGQNAAVLQALQLLNNAPGWEQIQYELDLKEQWPMKRLRWWCICAPPVWMAGPFCPWSVDWLASPCGC